MLESHAKNSVDSPVNDAAVPELPPGNHPVEVAARDGFGPLSALVREVWHGQAAPCVSCGQLVRRGDGQCGHCEQDLSPDMLAKMRAYAGPWHVFEHVRPFPGVTFERLVRQVRRGLLTETSIIRGPTTDHQWRFAVETPGLSRFFGKCWKCHGDVTLSDIYCRTCRAYLPVDALPGAALARNETPADVGTAKADPTYPEGSQKDQGESESTNPEWAALKAAIEQADPDRLVRREEGPIRVGGVGIGWFSAGLALLAMLVLLVVVKARTETSQSNLSSPGAVPVNAQRP